MHRSLYLPKHHSHSHHLKKPDDTKTTPTKTVYLPTLQTLHTHHLSFSLRGVVGFLRSNGYLEEQKRKRKQLQQRWDKGISTDAICTHRPISNTQLTLLPMKALRQAGEPHGAMINTTVTIQPTRRPTLNGAHICKAHFPGLV